MQLTDLCFSRNDSVKTVNKFLQENFKFSIDEGSSVESLLALKEDLIASLDDMYLNSEENLVKSAEYAKNIACLNVVENLLSNKKMVSESYSNDRVCSMHAAEIYPIVVHCHDVNGLELENAIEMALHQYRITPETGISDDVMRKKLKRLFCDEHPGEYPHIELELEEGDSPVTKEFNRLPDVANVHGDNIPTVYPVDDQDDAEKTSMVKEPPVLTKPMPSRRAVFNVDDGFTSFDANKKATVMPSIKPRFANRQKVFSSKDEPVDLYMNERKKIKFDATLNEGSIDLIAKEKNSDQIHVVRVKFMEGKDGGIIVKRVIDVTGRKYNVDNVNVLSETISKQIKKGK